MFGVVVDITLVPHDAYMFMIEYKIVETIKDEGILNALLTRDTNKVVPRVHSLRPQAERR